MRPAARKANGGKPFNQAPRHALPACAGVYEKIIQRTAAAGEDNFGKIEEMGEAHRLIGAESHQ